MMLASLAAAWLRPGAEQACFAPDWIVAPSYYTHDPKTGERTAQYARIGPIYAPPSANYVQSGFNHYRSSVVYGGTADHYYRVMEWGRPVRPFGEWLYPFRPYAVPFPLWNTPYYGMYQFFGWPPAYPPPAAGLPPTTPGPSPPAAPFPGPPTTP